MGAHFDAPVRGSTSGVAGSEWSGYSLGIRHGLRDLFNGLWVQHDGFRGRVVGHWVRVDRKRGAVPGHGRRDGGGRRPIELLQLVGICLRAVFGGFRVRIRINWSCINGMEPGLCIWILLDGLRNFVACKRDVFNSLWVLLDGKRQLFNIRRIRYPRLRSGCGCDRLMQPGRGESDCLGSFRSPF